MVLGYLLALGVILLGCVPSQGARIWAFTTFPPQQAMESGNYAGFLAENQQQLERCGGWIDCDLPLYNLAFVYAYPESPYRNPQRARRYVEELQSRYPHSPWASQGRLLIAFMNERSFLEEGQRRLRSELRAREAIIRKLRGQLHRSREIDVEIEKKERELLR
jgi:hypothetical protein